MRRDTTEERFRASTPASARSLPGRAASLSGATDRFAVRRTSRTSSRAAFSFARLLLPTASRLLARCRARTSRQRSSSQRASASSDRTRSRSQRNFQSTGPGADASDSCPSSATHGTGGVQISSMRISVRRAIARRIFRYQIQFRSDRNDAATDCRHRSAERLRASIWPASTCVSRTRRESGRRAC